MSHLLPFRRHPANPIVAPGRFPWRDCVVFNPAVIRHGGRFYLYERAAGQLRPFYCHLGALVSDDGVNFTHLRDDPVFTPAMCGSPHGSVQDPRGVWLDGRAWLTFAWRPYAWNCNPTGVGVPESWEPDLPGHTGRPEDNLTRSGLAVSDDLVNWRFHGWVTPPGLDDRNVILFPEKIGGRYAVLRRPLQLIGPAHGTDHPGVWLSWSEDLATWSEPRLVFRPAFAWENNRIGASTPPLRTPAGWLVFYHGVENRDPARRTVVYRLGAVLLDLDDPTRVLARTPHPIMEPETYYEQRGLFIPHVIFPTAAVPVGDDIWLYYGVCDTAIALSTIPLATVLDHLARHPWRGALASG